MLQVLRAPLRKVSPSGSAYSPRTMLSRLQLSPESGAAAGPPGHQPECPAPHGRPVTSTQGCRPRLPHAREVGVPPLMEAVSAGTLKRGTKVPTRGRSQEAPILEAPVQPGQHAALAFAPSP